MGSVPPAVDYDAVQHDCTGSDGRRTPSVPVIALCVLSFWSAGCSERRQPDEPPVVEFTDAVVLPYDVLSEISADDDNADAVTTDISLRDEAVERGLIFTRFDDMQGQRRILEVNGGGVGMLDLDLDGWIDVMLPNGCQFPLQFDRGRTPGKLFRNRRGQFSEVSVDSALVQRGSGTGVAVGDVNSDGFPDVYVTCIGRNQLWLNLGDGTFREQAADAGLHSELWGSSSAIADFDADGNVDLYVVNYLLEDTERPRLCPEPQAPGGFTGCTPAMFPGVADHLFLGDGEGHWRDVYPDSVAAGFPGKGLGVVAADLDADSGLELYVANDGQPNFLFSPGRRGLQTDLTADRQWEDLSAVSSLSVNDRGVAQASMGIAVADFDRRAGPDLFLTHFYRDTNTFYRNRSTADSMLFEDATRLSGLGPSSLNLLGFGTAAADLNRDGWEDLIIANGHIDDRTWFDSEQPWKMPLQVFQNLGEAQFVDVSAALGADFLLPRLGRGLAVGDLNRDGLTDVVISCQNDPAVLLINHSRPVTQAATVRLIGSGAARVPTGASVTVQGSHPSITRQLVAGGSFQSEHAAELEISGIQSWPTTLLITWPGGESQSVTLPQAGYWLIRPAANAVLMPL